MEKLIELTFEIEQELYDEAAKVCQRLGTTIEIMAEAFFQFCIVPENQPLLEAYINIEEESDPTDADVKIRSEFFEKVFAIAKQETEKR